MRYPELPNPNPHDQEKQSICCLRHRASLVNGVHMKRIVDLSHPILPGQLTHPGLPAPKWEVYRSREDYVRAGGVAFQIDQVTMVGNTGTYLDSPLHRFPDGGDLASVGLERVADLPIAVVDGRGHRAVDARCLAQALGSAIEGAVEGAAVLLYTGGDAGWGTPEYASGSPFLTEDGAEWLVDKGVALVGIDSVNIDDLKDQRRPAHTSLLAADVVIVEHLTNLTSLPPLGARLHAAPPAWHGVGTWPVRAYALVADEDR